MRMHRRIREYLFSPFVAFHVYLTEVGIDFPFRMKSSGGLNDGGLTHSPENSRECKLRTAPREY